jgi:hypothetical protein
MNALLAGTAPANFEKGGVGKGLGGGGRLSDLNGVGPGALHKPLVRRENREPCCFS